MSGLALLLIGVGSTDLFFSARPARWLPQVSGSVVVILVALAAGLTAPRDLAMVCAVVVAVLGWGLLVARGFGRGSAWEPLAWLAFALLGAALMAPSATPAAGTIQQWLTAGGDVLLGTEQADRVLLVWGAFLVQMSTGNVIVRLVLRATGTLNPAGVPLRSGFDRLLEGPAHSLKGGRLLGPMERVLILGLGLAGHLTAASIVVAAKGLLRFPELQSTRDRGNQGPGIHAVTEYFLVGSFASWLVALGTLVLIG